MVYLHKGGGVGVVFESHVPIIGVQTVKRRLHATGITSSAGMVGDTSVPCELVSFLSFIFTGLI